MNDQPTTQSNDSDVIGLIKRMQQQIAFLEQKIDLLINQLKERPAQEKNFSKPAFRSSDRPSRPSHFRDQRGPREEYRERPQSGNYYDKRHGNDSRDYRGPKKDYRDGREYGSGQGSHYKKKYDDKKRPFAPQGKPYFNKHKVH